MGEVAAYIIWPGMCPITLQHRTGRDGLTAKKRPVPSRDTTYVRLRYII